MHHGNVCPESAQGLLALKKSIRAAKIPSSKLDQTIHVAVWNLRECTRERTAETGNRYFLDLLDDFSRGASR